MQLIYKKNGGKVKAYGGGDSSNEVQVQTGKLLGGHMLSGTLLLRVPDH